MRSMHVDIAGGGPGGLFLARLLKLADPTSVVRVHERNGPDDTSGFGVVFSSRAMSSFRSADPGTQELIRRASVAWTGMEMRLPGGTLRYGGYGFAAISRQDLLRILRQQAVDAGAEMRFHSELSTGPAHPAGEDTRQIVVLADGASSANRDRAAGRFATRVEAGSAKYVWFATEATFDAVTFPFVVTEYGVFGAHAYPYGGGRSTFIVEADERTWRNAGMDGTTAASGQTDEHSRTLLGEVFAAHLGGHRLLGDNSRWANFRVVRNGRWSVGNTVLLGDAAHTAHFSVGSGTRMAMEDAIALAGALERSARIGDAFDAYEAERRQPVARIQALAERSMRWWESFGRRIHLPPHRFGLHFVTRTGGIGYMGLRRRHADRIAEAEAEFAAPYRTSGTPTGAGEPRSWRSALELPVTLGPVRLTNRIAARAPQPPPAAGSLLLADLRTGRRGQIEATPHASAAVLGLVVDAGTPADQVRRALRSSGARLVEVVSDATELSAAEAMLDECGPAVAVCAGLRCPPYRAWSATADRLVTRCRALGRRGLAGVHLHNGTDQDPGWDHLLTWADRIRTETALPVLLDGPPVGALGVGPDEGADDWPTRLHIAVVSGRVDVVVAEPPDPPAATPPRAAQAPATAGRTLS